MAGTLTISTLSDGTNSTSATNCIQGSAKAWVYFNGVTTTTINGSYNVSSVTRVGTGNYTVNFTNALSNANYATVCSAARNNAGDVLICGPKGNASTYTASAVMIQTLTDGGTFEDSPKCSVAIHI
jgi:hypothetical protein